MTSNGAVSALERLQDLLGAQPERHATAVRMVRQIADGRLTLDEAASLVLKLVATDETSAPASVETALEGLRRRAEALEVDVSDYDRLSREKRDALRDVRKAIRALERASAPRARALPTGEQYECVYAGCTRSFDTKQGLSMHRTRAHAGAR